MEEVDDGVLAIAIKALAIETAILDYLANLLP